MKTLDPHIEILQILSINSLRRLSELSNYSRIQIAVFCDYQLISWVHSDSQGSEQKLLGLSA